MISGEKTTDFTESVIMAEELKNGMFAPFDQFLPILPCKLIDATLIYNV